MVEETKAKPKTKPIYKTCLKECICGMIIQGKSENHLISNSKIHFFSKKHKEQMELKEKWKNYKISKK